MARSRITPVVVSSVPPTHAVQQILALGVQQVDQVGAVVHRDLRLVIGRGARCASNTRSLFSPLMA